MSYWTQNLVKRSVLLLIRPKLTKIQRKPLLWAPEWSSLVRKAMKQIPQSANTRSKATLNLLRDTFSPRLRTIRQIMKPRLVYWTRLIRFNSPRRICSILSVMPWFSKLTVKQQLSRLKENLVNRDHRIIKVKKTDLQRCQRHFKQMTKSHKGKLMKLLKMAFTRRAMSLLMAWIRVSAQLW